MVHENTDDVSCDDETACDWWTGHDSDSFIHANISKSESNFCMVSSSISNDIFLVLYVILNY